MFRLRTRRPRKPRVYRIPVETYLIALAMAFALSIAFSLLSGPGEIGYRLSHKFGVEDETFLPSSHALSNPYPTAGNRIRVLENGDEIYPAMLDAIARARSSINLESYIFWSGKIASRFRDALTERARSGVPVRLLLDVVGSGGKLSSDDIAALRTAGCVVEFFHPLRPWMLDTINNRTHRRLLVVDGRIGFTGGAGVADVWLGHADEPGHWRDTHVRVEGPIVAQLQAAFQENWAEVRGENQPDRLRPGGRAPPRADVRQRSRPVPPLPLRAVAAPPAQGETFGVVGNAISHRAIALSCPDTDVSPKGGTLARNTMTRTVIYKNPILL
jgi:phosphatidylserine/phosphatidylglycerophosphate/cardiolipin synthase-like enzyme